MRATNDARRFARSRPAPARRAAPGVRPRAAERGDARLVPVDTAVASDDRRLRFKAHALSALVAVVPATIAVYLSVNRRHDIVEGVVLQSDPLPFSLADEWHRYTHEVAAI